MSDGGGWHTGAADDDTASYESDGGDSGGGRRGSRDVAAVAAPAAVALPPLALQRQDSASSVTGGAAQSPRGLFGRTRSDRFSITLSDAGTVSTGTGGGARDGSQGGSLMAAKAAGLEDEATQTLTKLVGDAAGGSGSGGGGGAGGDVTGTAGGRVARLIGADKAGASGSGHSSGAGSARSDEGGDDDDALLLKPGGLTPDPALPRILGVVNDVTPRFVLNMWLTQGNPLQEILLAPDLVILQGLLESVPVVDADDLARALVVVFDAQHDIPRLMEHSIAYEVQQTAAANTLFRTNSIASKMMSAYACMVGIGYLGATIKGHVQGVCNRGVSLEIDPNKLKDGAQRKDNLVKLRALANDFLSSILDSLEMVPPTFRAICAILTRETTRKFGRKSLEAVAGFMFLRFIGPAIIAPQKFGILKKAPPTECYRTLILISKIIQNLANGQSFGAKEPYMIDLNDFIESNLARVQAFCDQLSLQAPRPSVAARERPKSIFSLGSRSLRVLSSDGVEPVGAAFSASAPAEALSERCTPSSPRELQSSPSLSAAAAAAVVAVSSAGAAGEPQHRASVQEMETALTAIATALARYLEDLRELLAGRTVTATVSYKLLERLYIAMSLKKNAFGKFKEHTSDPPLALLTLDPLANLLDMLFHDNMSLVGALLQNLSESPHVEVVDSLVYLFYANGSASQLMRLVMSHCVVGGTTSIGALVDNKLFRMFLNALIALPFTQQFIKNVLLVPLVTDLLESQCNFVFDPALSPDAIDNQQKTRDIMQSFLDRMYAHDAPVVFRHLIRDMLALFPGISKSESKFVVGRVLLLHVVSPAIVAPEMFDTLPQVPVKEVRRGMAVVAKVLQNFVNHASFKEPYMGFAGKLLERNKERLLDFFARQPEIPPDVTEEHVHPRSDVLRMHLQNLFDYTKAHIATLAKQLQHSAINGQSVTFLTIELLAAILDLFSITSARKGRRKSSPASFSQLLRH